MLVGIWIWEGGWGWGAIFCKRPYEITLACSMGLVIGKWHIFFRPTFCCGNEWTIWDYTVVQRASATTTAYNEVVGFVGFLVVQIYWIIWRLFKSCWSIITWQRMHYTVVNQLSQNFIRVRKYWENYNLSNFCLFFFLQRHV